MATNSGPDTSDLSNTHGQSATFRISNTNLLKAFLTKVYYIEHDRATQVYKRVYKVLF